MSWDKTVPLDTVIGSTIPSSIRSAKSDLQTALTAEHEFPGATPALPIANHKFPFGSTASRPSGVDGQIYIDTDKSSLEQYQSGAWVQVGAQIPSGSKTFFVNSVVPLGWTQDTTNDDMFIRVVSGAPGANGGSWSIPGAVSGNQILGTTHTHVVAGKTKSDGAGVSNYLGAASTIRDDHTHNVNGTSLAESVDVNHRHNITFADWVPAYWNVIVGVKV